MTDSIPQEPKAAWPYRTLFLWGHFGKSDPASRRLARGALLGVALFVAAALTTAALRDRIPGAEYIVVAAVGVATYRSIRAFGTLLGELDELSRRIQYEGIAFSFASMLLLGLTVSAWAVMSSAAVHPLVLFSGVILAEPLRGIGLVRAARKYR